MCSVSLKCCGSTTWCSLVVLLVFCSVLNQASAQLNLFLSKEDTKNYLSEQLSFEKGEKFVKIYRIMWRGNSIKICCSISEMDFQGKLYLIQTGVPATMVQNPMAFYHFMAPIDPSISELRMSWFSWPQVSGT